MVSSQERARSRIPELLQLSLSRQKCLLCQIFRVRGRPREPPGESVQTLVVGFHQFTDDLSALTVVHDVLSTD